MYREILALDNCYGCGVCAAVCPVGIILFTPDSHGFYRPGVAEAEKCIGCGYCSGSCASLESNSAISSRVLDAYAGYSKDAGAQDTASSGGIGYELGGKTVSEGDAVCVVRYNAAGQKAEHYVSDSPGSLAASKGSKYMQSDSAEGFRELLSRGRGMIVGTPCQMASMRKYLKIKEKEREYLLVDFFCHGTPSLLLWRKYVSDHPELAAADEVGFRDKRNGWGDSWRIWAKKEGQDVYFSPSGDLFYKFYLKNYVYNLPCYTCPFRARHSAADIRLGDMWGGKYGDGQDGYTSLLAFEEKGREALMSLEDVVLIPETPESATRWQIKQDQPVPPVRVKLLEELAGENTLEEIDDKYKLRLYLWRLRYRIKRRSRRLWRKRKK